MKRKTLAAQFLALRAIFLFLFVVRGGVGSEWGSVTPQTLRSHMLHPPHSLHPLVPPNFNTHTHTHSIEVKFALELILCVLTLLHICPHTTLYTCLHTVLYMLKLALQLIPLLQRVRALFLFCYFFFGYTHNTHTRTARQTDTHTQ